MKSFIAGLFVLFCALLGPSAPSGAAPLSDGDRKLYQAAFAAAEKGDMRAAWIQADKASDPLPALALKWLSLTRGGSGASFLDITQFVTDHPDWPSQQLLEQRVEESMSGASDADVSAWFSNHPPVSFNGKLREAEITISAGDRDKGEARIREIWINSDLAPFDEKSMQQRFRGVLRPVDNQLRLDRLLWDGQTAAAKRMLPLVSGGPRTVAETRLALAALKTGADQTALKLPPDQQKDLGLIFDLVRWYRRKFMDSKAIELLDNAPADPNHATQWAVEREFVARRALTDGQPDAALRLAERHDATTGPAFAELEFLSGWIALRFLNKPEIAYDHFVRLYNEMKLPISLSRGAYWAARASEAMGKKDLATKWYDNAADKVTTYYGQLAAEARSAAPASVLDEPKPKPEEIAAFEQRELVQVTRDLGDVGANETVRPFLRRLSDLASTPSDFVLVTRLAIDIGRPDLAVAAAKRAGYAGVNLIAEGYPIPDLPPTSKQDTVETPLLLAMTRQESAFDHAAVSHAGARGLMQLMPKTASLVAKLLHIPYSKQKLTTDKLYNVTLGRAYIDGLLNDFSGSYVLAVASYNAGPARVREWIRDYGDPRSSNVDVIDWVESIPIDETRNYVQRVLENLQIYRLRLGETTLAFTLASDLKR
ncbi:MAG TPA: lytic transglycosylase domain-containing protein [Stellaceae bacterium]|nr:lytic transglycosylase domain-containing protein [Stellaceae bacterium]